MAYSEKFKEKLVARALAPDANVSDIARQAGIAKGTLFGWVNRSKVDGMSSRGKKKRRGRPRKASRLSAAERLKILTEASALSDDELGAYLREMGLHAADLEEIREAALAGLEPPKRAPGPSAEELENRKLRKELKRKEAALAETAALLVLSKKYRAIMGDGDDDTGESGGENS